MMELDPVYASVIVERYAEYIDCTDGIFVRRNGEELPYDAVAAADV